MVRAFAVLLVLSQAGQAASSGGRQRPVPPALASLAERSGLKGSITAWCPGEFRDGHPGAFAVALSAPGSAGGRYLVLDAESAVADLDAFEDTPDLACYTPAEAKKLGNSLEQSETIEGHLAPRWKTTIICGFVDATTARCWQYSPADRRFVKIGGWIT